MARENGQRMGMGVRGCLNIAEWNHLFTPNSNSAEEARNNCVDYWMNIGQNPSLPKRLKSESGNDDDIKKSVLSPKNVIMLLVVLAVVYYFMRK